MAQDIFTEGINILGYFGRGKIFEGNNIRVHPVLIRGFFLVFSCCILGKPDLAQHPQDLTGGGSRAMCVGRVQALSKSIVFVTYKNIFFPLHCLIIASSTFFITFAFIPRRWGPPLVFFPSALLYYKPYDRPLQTPSYLSPITTPVHFFYGLPSLLFGQTIRIAQRCKTCIYIHRLYVSMNIIILNYKNIYS